MPPRKRKPVKPKPQKAKNYFSSQVTEDTVIVNAIGMELLAPAGSWIIVDDDNILTAIVSDDAYADSYEELNGNPVPG